MSVGIRYPSLDELTEKFKDLNTFTESAREFNPVNIVSELEQPKNGNAKSHTAERNKWEKVNRLFLLGDNDHLKILNWAISSPEYLSRIGCSGLTQVSEFLVRRKSKKGYCSKLEKCVAKNCARNHIWNPADHAEFRENVPILIAFLFFRPAVRRKLVLPSFARDHFERISRSKFQEIDITKVILTIRDWSFTPLHDSGMGFNPWIFIKFDYCSYFSAKDYFLMIFLNILKNDAKCRCGWNSCGLLTCTKVHFDVNQIDQTGSFRWILRLILNEANVKFDLYKNEEIETIVVNTATRFLKENLSSYSLVSQYASLLILAGLDVEFHDQILFALKSFTVFSETEGKSKHGLTDDDTIHFSDLDPGRLLESCFSVLHGSLKSHRLLTVSQYGCSIGEAYMKILLDTFRKHLAKFLKKRRIFGISQNQIDSILKEDVPYTMAMHLWLFKSSSCLEIAKELQNMKIKGFRDIDKGVVTVENWKNAAINACNERNYKWLALMKTPSPSDFVLACETFMPNWINAFSSLIRKSEATSHSSSAKKNSVAQRRWEDEKISLLSEDDDMTDWRKIIRFLRNYYLNHTDSKDLKTKHRFLAAILNYLLHASHQLKHTDYASFDAEFFLFLAYKLFEKLEILCLNDQLQLLTGYVDESIPRSKISGFVSFSPMSDENRVNVSSKFEMCKIEIAKFLPLEGAYLQKWVFI